MSLAIFEKFPELFDKAEISKDWSFLLLALREISEKLDVATLPDWLYVELIWLKVQFEKQLQITEVGQSEAIHNNIAMLNSLFPCSKLVVFDEKFLLLDKEYLSEQGFVIECRSLSQYLANPNSKEISPHILFDLIRYKNQRKLDVYAHHPVVHFFRYSNGFGKQANPNAYFDCTWYKNTYLNGTETDHPLLHYLANFQNHYINPAPHFYNSYVRQIQSLGNDIEPLGIYLKALIEQGVDFRLQGISPCPYFDRKAYVANFPDIKSATEKTTLDPFAHFCMRAIIERRKGHSWLKPDMFSTVTQRFQGKSKVAVLVLGMHRSGTSALTRVINLLGIDLSGKLWGKNASNETGYWESSELTGIHDQILHSFASAWDDISAIDGHFWQTEDAQRYIALLENYIVKEFEQSESFAIKDPRMCKLIPLWIEALKNLNVDIKIIRNYSA